jgi:CRP/FNR family cyclic AMP-dependent transcriptional regulator
MYLHPLIAHIPQVERDALKEVTELRSYKRNQLLVEAGMLSQHIYCVATGLLRVALHSQGNSDEVTTDFIRPDEFFLPPSFREDAFESPATVIAALPSVVYAIPLKSIRALCARYAVVSIGLLEMESKRIGQLRTQLRRVATSSVEKLVGRVLHELTDLAPSASGGYDKRITQSVIASYSGISREVVNKTMRDMENRGLVTKDDQGIHVPSSFATTDFGSVLPIEQNLSKAQPHQEEPMFDLDLLKRNVVRKSGSG